MTVSNLFKIYFYHYMITSHLNIVSNLELYAEFVTQESKEFYQESQEFYFWLVIRAKKSCQTSIKEPPFHFFVTFLKVVNSLLPYPHHLWSPKNSTEQKMC